MSKLAIVAAILPAAAWWWTNSSLLRLQYLNRVRNVPSSRCRLLNGGRLALFDSTNPSASERDSGIDDHAPTPQTSLRRHTIPPLRTQI
jgi:hypothetical protein